ncbi:hypothetical protein T265_07577 [Opisthorchis viverrini]|uniref:Uncharacterized protein n=1 Tax=Opisthorchis viverrini TaxID=6198 RepID=A0A074ZGQ6_OPIVI|nr:hypothetical protein T265_07577 [Opisthorchis viverrini]KER24847.1 hypothetical protein T265_07577 [Opisthorchis viverrini]
MNSMGKEKNTGSFGTRGLISAKLIPQAEANGCECPRQFQEWHSDFDRLELCKLQATKRHRRIPTTKHSCKIRPLDAGITKDTIPINLPQ